YQLATRLQTAIAAGTMLELPRRSDIHAYYRLGHHGVVDDAFALLADQSWIVKLTGPAGSFQRKARPRWVIRAYHDTGSPLAGLAPATYAVAWRLIRRVETGDAWSRTLLGDLVVQPVPTEGQIARWPQSDRAIARSALRRLADRGYL